MTFPISTDALLASLDSQLENMLIAAIGSADALPASTQAALQAAPSQAVLLTGTVTSQTTTAANTVEAVLQTAAGPVTLTLNAPAPQGTITVQVQQGAPGQAPTATVLVPRSATPQIQQAGSVTSAPAVSSLPSTTPPPPLTAGSTITGTVMLPLPSAPQTMTAATLVSTPQAPSPLSPPPSEALAQSLPPALPLLQPALAKLSQAVPPSLLEAIDPALAAQEESAPAFLASPFLQQTQSSQPGNEAFYVVSVAEESSPSETSAAVSNQTESSSSSAQVQQTALANTSQTTPAASNTVAGMVIASTPGGQPILALPTGTLLVNEPASVKSGATVVLQPLGSVEDLEAAHGGGATPAPLPLAFAGKELWPALAQTLKTLGALEPEQASALQAAIPRLTTPSGAPAANFPAALVSFLTGDSEKSIAMAALPAGTLASQASANDTVNSLRAALSQAVLDLADIATGTAGHAAQQVPNQIMGGWQNYPIPVLTGAEIAMLQLYVRRHIDPEEDEEKDAPGKPKRRRAMTRFLVEVHPATLGPVQLDGLVQKESYKEGQAANPHLDLVVRTETDLPPQAASEMGVLFDSALGATGVTGRLTFQSGRDSFVLPESGAAPAYRREV